MNLSKLIARNLFRHKLRSFLAMLGIAIAVTAFALLRTVIDAWYFGVEMSSENRLVTRSAISLISPLPLAYGEKIAKIPGVTAVGHGTWFGGFYKEEKNFFSDFAINPHYLNLYPELLLSAEEKKVFETQKNTCIIGENLAKRFGWKIGDTVRIIGNIFPGNWDFVVRGIYRGAKKSTDRTMFFFRWDYLDERMKRESPSRAGHVGWFLINIKNPDDAAIISKTVDSTFKNSLYETITETEKAFQLSFLSMVETIIKAMKVVSVIIIGIILIVLSNTMAMTARERIPEYATLKTMGFGARDLISLIGGESIMIALCGGLTGIILTFPIVELFGKAIEKFLPVFEISNNTIALSFLISLVVGISSSIFPLMRAIKLSIAQSLRKVG
ncbi:MAG: ABC transporter ATP-binding protein [Candidatus Schekmanbacteria bacterium GWA2_38_9]|uniref:ABC transporter ATP-binding protein n=1 Tax=Candidatus Schekmanbacteria bacterium RIFCSPLOWO2_12_FULL_38_15 TaxID=1817883 RepID=A0A1F7SJT2_9BACT|nr:MAG: ABC transporter ATP-binding protein [Candidatus Schekmanbacteria bacterium GWA2_38_9]OGL50763.1 MAG: ABC transporter ATP-binding protein [Candidatus Schekmanbacteria bacterium RIFCSPLOWO2_02_FULL_38_14]OGL53477.1 MAG: ABC transporter ATP-binding protein [Candidatus Schekmanbacteria bacterium RIFCSPLOWO2_12_FULL_38_15]